MSFKRAIMPAASPGETCDGICPPDDWGLDELGEVTREGEYQGCCGDCSEEEGRDSPSCCSFDPLRGFITKKTSSKHYLKSVQHTASYGIYKY